MKLTLFVSLLGLLPAAVNAATATQLSCSLRKNVVISRFSHNLSTMKWGDHFIIASGVKKNRTEENVPFRVTSFQNGDDLVFFPESEKYYMFYSGSPEPDRCIVQGSKNYEITQLPRYEKPQV
ncbi:hypothetical protein [Dryocola sp. LX212]|jgi:hypothetical protein